MFFVVELADGLGGIFKSWVISINYDLRNDSSDFAMLVFLGKSVMNGLSEPVADLTLAHCDGGFERHGGSFVGRGLFFVDEDVADLRAITVSDDDFIFTS